MSDSGPIPTDCRLRPRRVGAVGGHQISELNDCIITGARRSLAEQKKGQPVTGPGVRH